MIHKGFSVPVNVRLPTPSSHSQIRRRVVLHQNSYGGFRLGAAGRVIELRRAENDPKETFATSEALSQKGTLVKGSLRHLPGFSLAYLARIALARASSFAASVVRPVFLNTPA